MNFATIHFVYEITCPRCFYYWSATKEETFDLDVVSCPKCCSSDLNIVKRLEV